MSLLHCPEAQSLLEDAVVSRQSVLGCGRRLAVFLQRYLPLFYRREHREHATLAIQGRLGNLQRKTCEPIAREAGVERKPLQLFVGNGKWDDEAVMAEVRRHVAEEFDDPQTVFVLDGSGFPKKGTESCGVRRQWCGRLGKIENCQVGVFLACVSQGRVGPLGRRLYLPSDWASDGARRRKCHVPTHVRFRAKWELGLQLVTQASDVPHGWVVADDEFGRVSKLRSILNQRGERYVLDVPCNTTVRGEDLLPSQDEQSLTPAERRRKRWLAAKRARARKPVFQRADAWAAQQPASRWRRIEVRPGEQGPLVVQAIQTVVQTRERGRIGRHERLIVIRTVEAIPRTHYCLCNEAAAPLEEVVAARMCRHRIEEMFELGNQEVGLDHYEVRGWVGWHHHMTLSLLALWFVVLETWRTKKKDAGNYGAASAAHLQPAPAASRAHGRTNRTGSYVGLVA
jgi:SRSO17 transposase